MARLEGWWRMARLEDWWRMARLLGPWRIEGLQATACLRAARIALVGFFGRVLLRENSGGERRPLAFGESTAARLLPGNCEVNRSNETQVEF
jgi:hypothetical protein